MIQVQLRAAFFTFWEGCRVPLLYYRSLSFFLADLYLQGRYFFLSPFKISKRYLQKKGDANIYQYGPTPLTTLDRIAKECSISSQDTVYELGCGIGRTALWLGHFIKCKVVGVERIDAFVQNATRASQLGGWTETSFLNQDMFETDYKEATVLYLYGTLLSDSEIEQLCNKFHSLAPDTKIITVSYPLTDYDSKNFALCKQFTANFPWGRGEVYLNTRL